MDWITLVDPVHVWNWLLAQTPTPAPSPSRTAELELLKSQLEFLKDAN